MRDIGDLTALGMNGAGTVVGQGNADGQAIVWDAERGVRRLVDLPDPTGPFASRVLLESAIANT